MERGVGGHRTGRAAIARHRGHAVVSAGVATERHRRWARPYCRPRARRDGLRRGGRPPGHHRPVRDDHAVAHLCRTGAEPELGVRSRLIAGGDHRGHRRSARGRRSGPRRRAGRRSRHHLGRLGGGVRGPPSRPADGPALDADPDRLPQRHRTHGDRSQLPKLFGFSTDADGRSRRRWRSSRRSPAG